MCWSSRSAEQQVVASDRIRHRDAAFAAERERGRRRHAARRASAHPDPAPIPVLAHERHPLALDGIEAHPRARPSSAGDLADVGGLLVGRHRPAAHDVLRLADHQPRRGGSGPSSPTRREQVVAELEPDLERGAGSGCALETLALGDQLAGPGDELVAGHAQPASRRRVDPRARAPRAARPRVHAPGVPSPIAAPRTA